MYKYLFLLCWLVGLTHVGYAQNIKKSFESLTYLSLQGDTVKPLPTKNRIYICVGSNSCGLCFFQLEAFLNTLDTSRFELALLIQSTHTNKYLVQSKNSFIKKIKTVYHIPISNDYERDCKEGLFKRINACGNPAVIIATKNNGLIELIKYKKVFTNNGDLSLYFKTRITTFLK
ncbi:MAG: hypothetical protein V4538_00410 [Bacteroidota bacterium]